VKDRNTARFFTENRHISWVLLAFVVLWGVWGYWKMPKRKDPEVPVRVAVAVCAWPGASAEKVEQLVTQKIEEKIAENAKVMKIQSISRTSVGIVYVELAENVTDPGKQLDDIKLKLDSIRDLPRGAGPIDFVKDFGDTAALMLTVASPSASEVEVSLRAREIRKAIEGVRDEWRPSPWRSAPVPLPASGERVAEGRVRGATRVSVIACVPPSISTRAIERRLDVFQKLSEEYGIGRNCRRVVGSGFAGLDFESDLGDAQILAFVERVNANYVQGNEDHPDLWPPVVIRDPAGTEAALGATLHDKYSYRDLDRYTDIVKKTLQAVPQVSKITRSGVLKEKIYLDYSQERLASYGLQTSLLDRILSARNITLPGGMLQVGRKNLVIDPSGEFHSEKEIGDVIVSSSASGTPLYLRDLVDVNRTYDTPARFLNFYQWRDGKGVWHRSRAITLAVQMKSGEQIANFGRAVDAALHDVRVRLPEDLIIARTSDQPLQVEENVDLFMKSLYEAIALVVLVALIGFWEWRSALLMALSIPLTLAMTFGMMLMLGVDLQQVSIASLIIALGLLVDDPVVAGDAIKRELAAGQKPIVAAWLGPTKLATAILFATITNIVAYLPLLLLRGDTGKFIYTLPIVLTCSLVASRIVSMTFIPLLGYYILRPGRERANTPSRFATLYRRTGQCALDHRWQVLAFSFVFLALGGLVATRLQKSFFPKDYSYLSYVDVWLPEDAPLTATNATAQRAEAVVRRVAGDKLASLTTFVGGGGPRFWFSVSPELQQLNYAQIVVQVKDKHDTAALVPRMQRALASEIAGARCDVQQLETGPPIGIPVAIRISGTDVPALRAYAEKVKAIFRSIPEAERVRDDWGAESFAVKLQVDPDRANLAGVTNLDVAVSSASSMNGLPVTTMREGDQQIPVAARLRSEERAQLADVQNLYVSSLTSQQKVPLRQVSKVSYGMETEKLRRRNQFRTITVACFPIEGVLPSEVLNKARARIAAIAGDLPPGYKIEIGGEEEEQVKGFADMTAVMVISIVAIFVALVIQFRNAVKPLVVFAAIPYGVVGALIVLVLAGAPFGFMAFLGVSSLIGVIVSHVIVLFDFIEEAHHRGESLNDALLDAGIVRLRPVLITVGATVLGLIPLASHGGPLWESMCYAQIGGLSVATAITLLMVPVIYAIFVHDLKLIAWERPGSPSSAESTSAAEISFA
jgi:multidrug efflux pump subunit AcrB